MLDKLYITPRQWLRILRWTMYSLLFLTALLVQTVVLGNRTLFGTHPTFVPLVITCVCLREGAERGGLFALLASLFWCLSGADQGSLSIFTLTVVPVLGTVVCSAVLRPDPLLCRQILPWTDVRCTVRPGTDSLRFRIHPVPAACLLAGQVYRKNRSEL